MPNAGAGRRANDACGNAAGRDSAFSRGRFSRVLRGKSRTAAALGGTPVTIHRYVPDCDAAIQQAVEAGATVKMPATDMFWGDRFGVVIDPFGHNWSLATHNRELTPEEMAQGMREAFELPD